MVLVESLAAVLVKKVGADQAVAATRRNAVHIARVILMNAARLPVLITPSGKRGQWTAEDSQSRRDCWKSAEITPLHAESVFKVRPV